MNFLVMFLGFLVLTLSAHPSGALSLFVKEKSEAPIEVIADASLLEAFVKDAGTRLRERHLENTDESL